MLKFSGEVLDDLEKELESDTLNPEERFDAKNTYAAVLIEREAVLRLIEKKDKSLKRKKRDKR